MGIPKKLKNMNIHVDGEGYLGRASEYEEPALALATAVIEGPHEAALQQQCQRLVELCRRQLGGSEGTVRT